MGMIDVTRAACAPANLKAKFLACPPYPLSALLEYLRTLASAFGWGYVVSVMLLYGINQGVGEALMYYARRYYLLDDVGFSVTTTQALLGFAGFPWHIKSLFGLLSDFVPVRGYHRAPYIFFAGVVGVIATALLTFADPRAFSPFTYGLLLAAININFAMPDVMIDATVVERTKLRPDLAAELQGLCWGSINTIGVPFAIAKAYMYVAGGAKLLFGFCIATAACVIIPPACGWVEQPRRPRAAEPDATAARRCCPCDRGAQRAVAGAAAIVGIVSPSIGVLSTLAPDWPGLTAFVLCCDLAVCAALYLVLRTVDKALAGAAIYTFLSRALCPVVSNQVFDWFHAPSADSTDHRCLSAAACLALESNATAASSDAALECGWARIRGYPCIDPIFVGWVSAAGKVALSLGVWAYVACLQKWRFKAVFAFTQALMCAASFADLLWVSRANLALGISDHVWMLLGDELFFDFVYKLNQLPFLIYAAKLCPPGVEACMFALFMGLSNFGRDAAEFFGAGLLALFGGVARPDYPHMEGLVALSCALKLLPIALVPFLVPEGTPSGTAKEMGASAAVTGEAASASAGEAGGSESIMAACVPRHKGAGAGEVSYVSADLEKVAEERGVELRLP